jgi:hypothetical protein
LVAVGWLLVVGCWLLVVGCWLLVVGCWLVVGWLVVGRWLAVSSVVGCWLLSVGWRVVGCWLLLVPPDMRMHVYTGFCPLEFSAGCYREDVTGQSATKL